MYWTITDGYIDFSLTKRLDEVASIHLYPEWGILRAHLLVNMKVKII